MEQKQELLMEWSHHAKLDAAAQAVSTILAAQQKKHGFFGGYAVSLLGGNRMTNDVDIIVGENPQSIREQLLQDERFSVTAGNKLKFKLEGVDGQGPEASSTTDITVEMLQGGANQQLKLPDANRVPMVWLNPRKTSPDRADCELPVIHPVLLFLTKMKRWMFIAKSSRPASQKKAHNDLYDIKTLLEWMVGNEMTIDFSMYPEKAKEELLPGVQMLLTLGDPDIPGMLQKTLDTGDFQMIQ